MSTAEHIVAGALVFLGGGCAAYWGVGLARILDGFFGGFSARRGLRMPLPADASGRAPSVCVVVPCFNEARAVAPLVRSLLAQDYPNLSVVFSLDRCTDDTRAVIERESGGDPRIEFVEIARCPDGWAGKVHAMHAGVRGDDNARDAAFILFVDADCELESGCVRATVAIAHERSLDLLSLWSTLTRGRWFERIVQPATTMELIRPYPLRAANRDTRRRAMANGQFMLFRREAYDAVGGIESVRDSVLEDVEIARRMKHAGKRTGVFIADGLLVCRMYDDYASFRRGWERIFIECARRRSPRLRAFAYRKALVHLALPAASIAGVVWGLALLAQGRGDPFAGSLLIAGSAGTLAYWTSMSVLLGAQGLFAYLPALPVGTACTIGIMLSAARMLRRGETIRWGGREYRLVDAGRAPRARTAVRRPATDGAVASPD